MALNLYTGSAGSGKTYQAIETFSSLMKEKNVFPNSLSFFIVPEQFSVDIERKILNSKDISGFIGSEVISFNRLIYRIVSNTGVELGVKTTKSLSSMLLMSVIHKVSRQLVYFKDCENNPSCIDFLYNAVTELQKNDISPEFLLEISKKADDDQSAIKLSEFSLILSEYNKELKNDRLFDSEVMTDFAIEKIYDGKTELSGATVFVDSFVGFTYNEIRLLKAINRVAKEVNVYLFDKNDDSPIFSCPKKTILQFKKEFERDDQKVNIINLEVSDINKTRFSKAPELFFLSENYGNFKIKTYAGENTDAIIMASCPDIYHEIECCAKYIVKLIKDGYKPHEIAVVVPDLDENHYVISSVFKDKNIPCFVDMRSDLSSHPAILFVDSFLKIICDDFKLEYVLKLLKTGLYKASAYSGEQVSKLENLLLKYNVDNEAGMLRLISKIEKKENILKEEALLKDFYETISKIKKKASSNKASKVSYVLNEIVEIMGIAGIEGEIKNRAKSCERTFLMVWNSYIDIIKECDLALGDTEITGYKKLHGYVRELLMAAITGKEVAIIPSAGSYVQVGDINRSRYIDKKIIMILGANDGSFPKNDPDTGFIGDNERDLITKFGGNISYNSMERSFLSQFNIYSVMMSAREKLYISWSKTDDDGKEISKSSAVKRIGEMFPSHQEICYVPNEIDEIIDTEGECEIDEALIREILEIQDKYKTSISRVEGYEACPYGFFLENILKLRERKNGDFDKSSMGTLMHAMFERACPLSKEKNDGNFDDINLTNWKEYIKKAFDEYVGDEKNSEISYLFENSEKNKFLVERALRFAADEGTKMCEFSKKTGFAPSLFETTFGKDDSSIKGVAINVMDFVAEFNGIIDRIDVREQDGKKTISVVDYKQRFIKPDDVINGIDLQLSMYYSALKSGVKEDLAAKIGEIAFVHSLTYYTYGIDYDKENIHEFSAVINSDQVTEDKEEPFQSNVKKKKFTSLEILEKNNQEIIASSLENMVSGKFPKRPADFGNNKSKCGYCAFHDACKYKK